MQANWDSAKVEDSFLVLTQPVQRLVRGRKKLLLHLPDLRVKSGRYIEGFAALLWFGQHGLPVSGEETHCTGPGVYGHSDERVGEPDLLFPNPDLKVVSPTRLRNDRNLGAG